MTNEELYQELTIFRKDLSNARETMAGVIKCFETWKVTRCDDHDKRLNAVEKEQKAQSKVINKTAGIAALIGASVPTLISFLGAIAALKHLGVF